MTHARTYLLHVWRKGSGYTYSGLFDRAFAVFFVGQTRTSFRRNPYLFDSNTRASRPYGLSRLAKSPKLSRGIHGGRDCAIQQTTSRLVSATHIRNIVPYCYNHLPLFGRNPDRLLVHRTPATRSQQGQFTEAPQSYPDAMSLTAEQGRAARTTGTTTMPRHLYVFLDVCTRRKDLDLEHLDELRV